MHIGGAENPEEDDPVERAADDEFSCLFRRSLDGDRAATDQTIALLYDRLRAHALSVLRRYPMVQTISATAVANEVYLKLSSSGALHARSEEHFFAIAARAAKQVVVDYCKYKTAGFRGGEWTRVFIDPARLEKGLDGADANDLHEALAALEAEDPDLHRVAMLRLFTDKTLEDIAAMMGTTRSAIDHRWRAGRAWLHDRLGDSGGGSAHVSPR
jgi:RNA polymerase sigma factor (TIGR02999 family)